MPLRYEEIMRILKDLGFVFDRQTWSHERYEKWECGMTVAHHKEFLPKTAKSMLKNIAETAGLEVKELIKRYKIKL